MKEKIEHIDSYFKEKLENFEDTPGPEVWNNIADKLGHNKKRKLLIFMSRVAAGILLAVSIGLGYYFLNKDSSRVLTESVEKTVAPEKEKTVAPGKEKAAASRKSGESPVAIQYKKVTGNERSASPESVSENIQAESVSETIPAENISETIPAESLIPGKPAEKDYTESRQMLARIESIAADKIENNVEEDISTAEITGQSPVEKSLIYEDYLTENNIVEEEKAHTSRWTVGGQLAPLYSYRNVSSDYLDSYVKDQINSKESGLITYAAGLNVAVSPGRRLTVQSGIYYSKYGQQTDAVDVFTSTPESRTYEWDNNPEEPGEETTNVLISQSIGTVSSNDDLLKFNQSINANAENSDELRYFNVKNAETVDNASATQYFEYLEIPLVIKYKLIDKKIDFNILSGISTHFLIGNNLYLDYNNMNSKFSENVIVNTINYSSSLGIGIEYPVLSRLLINVEPEFKYYINPLVKNPSYNIHPYSLGIYTGISYVF
jgi:hypothetical protein